MWWQHSCFQSIACTHKPQTLEKALWFTSLTQTASCECSVFWAAWVAQQNSCIIPQGDEEWRDDSTDQGLCPAPLLCLEFLLVLWTFSVQLSGMKSYIPKPAQKLRLFLSAFGTRHTFRLVLHISQIWSHHHQEDTSSHWGVQSSSMAEPDNERQMYSCWEGFPSLP